MERVERAWQVSGEEEEPPEHVNLASMVHVSEQPSPF